jgi:isopropylmalate/homocitrate/citramalate synthase
VTARVKIVEVGPRDGLQNEAAIVSPAQRVEFIRALLAAGLTTIEAGSFVSPKWVPQMAGTAEVLQTLRGAKGNLPVLVPNERGLDDAIAAGAREVAVFPAASETFSQKNINCSIAESIERFRPVVARAREHDVRVRGYVSCVLGCPYEGEVPIGRVVHVAEQLVALGCYEVSLGDTIGVGTPGKARALVRAVAGVMPKEQIAIHLHDTYGQALANIYACLEEGIAIIDSSAGGLGGCPYAKGATGNVATEDVVYMLNGLGIETDVDLDRLLDAVVLVSKIIGRAPASRVARAKRG